MYVDITLNSDLLPNIAQEFAAKTMMHETLHAMFLANGDARNGILQHNQIANSYIDALANALMSNFPNMSQQDAIALSWSGVDFQNTTAWAALPTPTQNLYRSIAESYWLGIKFMSYHNYMMYLNCPFLQ